MLFLFKYCSAVVLHTTLSRNWINGPGRNSPPSPSFIKMHVLCFCLYVMRWVDRNTANWGRHYKSGIKLENVTSYNICVCLLLENQDTWETHFSYKHTSYSRVSASWHFVCMHTCMCDRFCLSSLAFSLYVYLCGHEGGQCPVKTPLYASGHYCLSSQTSLLVCIALLPRTSLTPFSSQGPPGMRHH